jgi:hypothetical protein
MPRKRKSRTRRRRRRDRKKVDTGGSFKSKAESPFKWSWHHSLVPKYVTGKITGKGPGLKTSVKDEFTWKGIHNKGGRRRTRRRRRRRRRTRRRRRRCGC